MKPVIFALSLTLLFVTGGFFASSTVAHAVIDENAKKEIKQTRDELGGPSQNDLADKIKAVIDLLLYLAATIAVIVIVVSGVRFVTADGDPAKADKARTSVIYAAIGLVISVSAYAIVTFVLERFK